VQSKVLKGESRCPLSPSLSFFTCSIVTEEERSTKLQSCDSQGKLWLTRALGLVETFAADTKHVSLAVEVDDEIIEGRAAAQKALKAIQKASSGCVLMPYTKESANTTICKAVCISFC